MHTVSSPLTPIEVRPVDFTAAKEYSTWINFPSGLKTVMVYSWAYEDILNCKYSDVIFTKI